MKRTTSFGTMETLLERDGKIVSELLFFDKEGRGHSHDVWEHCYILNGEGTIVVGEDEIYVKKGDICKIPPATNHWMIPNPEFEILLVYAERA